VRALEVAQHIARRVQQLVDALIAAGGAAARIGSALRRAGARIREAEPALRASAAALHRAAESSPTPLVTESGKQLTDATQRRDDWRKAQP
jgi:adenine/guanine phosphoribosyltransferase-like PRPP-binding protein